VSDATLSDFFAGPARGQATQRVPVLHVVMRASDPAQRPSRHVLDGIQVVHFGRGEPRATLDVHAGMKRLIIRIADPVMSTSTSDSSPPPTAISAPTSCAVPSAATSTIASMASPLSSGPCASAPPPSVRSPPAW